MVFETVTRSEKVLWMHFDRAKDLMMAKRGRLALRLALRWALQTPCRAAPRSTFRFRQRNTRTQVARRHNNTLVLSNRKKPRHLHIVRVLQSTRAIAPHTRLQTRS